MRSHCASSIFLQEHLAVAVDQRAFEANAANVRTDNKLISVPNYRLVSS
jgi:hypothetical protein